MNSGSGSGSGLTLDQLHARWAPLPTALPAARRGELLAELGRRYSEPQRGYHGVAHIAALARLHAEVAGGPGWRAPDLSALACLYHDAIYEPGRPDNEARSAELARTELAGHGDPIDLERVAAMILATADHGELGQSNADADPDLAHFLDADMAILGAPAPDYAAYLAGVRHEFAAVPTAVFEAGRRRFVAAQLDRPHLFHTPWFRSRYEAQARANLVRELGPKREQT